MMSSFKFLATEGVLDWNDKVAYPVPQNASLTSRDLTIMLLKQHEFLVNRVGSLHVLTKIRQQETFVSLIDGLKK
jgi:hypothetical protein